MTDYWLSSHGKCGGHGGPQADDGVERKLSGINRELKEMGPQADEVRKQVSINDERWMITDFVHTENTEGIGGPQADDGGEQGLINDER